MDKQIISVSGIYAITNSLNGKQYVGSSVHFSRRWIRHKHDLNKGSHHSSKLQRAWNKYGQDAFKFSVLEVVSDHSKLLLREQHWLDLTKCSDTGYNILCTAGSTLGKKQSKEAIEKTRAANTGRKFSDEHRAKLSAWQIGRIHSEETRAKRSAALKGRPRAPEVVARMGRKNSLETIAKRVATRKATELAKKIAAVKKLSLLSDAFYNLDDMKNSKFTQLIADNEMVEKSFKVTAKDDGNTRIDLYDMIDDQYGVSATSFVDAINSIKSGDISLHINSPGGDVFSARAMVAAISAHPSNITAYIDGLAASAASCVAVACDKVVMQKGSMMMVHCASSIVWGNSADMLEMSKLLDKIDATIASDYARKTGKSESEMLALMLNESWLTADEALEIGFADAVIENDKGKPTNVWNLSAFKNAPAKPEPEIIPDPIIEPTNEPAQAGFFMAAANQNRLRLLQIA